MSDLEGIEIPGHVTLADGRGGLPKVLIDTAWSNAEIYLHGAHVTQFQKIGEAPMLFMSTASEFDAHTPIRGGIPVIFPWFGAREGMQAHGDARTSAWTLQETAVLADGAVTLSFHLPSTAFYNVEYRITVADSLSLELTVTNVGALDFTFETCLHTYFKISNIRAISIHGLQNTTYQDKLTGQEMSETAQAVHFDREVDRIYYNTRSPVEILDSGLKRQIRVEKSGSESTVVWNPWIEKSKRMADFGDEEYLQMVCVESGNVAANKITLLPGGCAILKIKLGSEPLIF